MTKCLNTKAAAVSNICQLHVTQSHIIKKLKMSLKVTVTVKNSCKCEYKVEYKYQNQKSPKLPTCRYVCSSLLISVMMTSIQPFVSLLQFRESTTTHRKYQEKAPQSGLVRHRQLSFPFPQSHIKGLCSLRREGKKKCLNVLSILITDKTRLWRDHALKNVP